MLERLEGPKIDGFASISFSLEPLQQLLDAVPQGVRLYELFTLHHLHDLFPYVAVYCNVEGDAREMFLQRDWWHGYDHIRDGLPITYEEFLSSTRHYKRGPPWRIFADSEPLRTFFLDALAAIEREQARLRASEDQFIRFELAQIARHDHACDWDMLMAGAESPTRINPIDISTAYSQDFYACLKAILAEPAISSVAYRGQADFQTLRLITEERWRRHGTAATSDPTLFPVNVLPMGRRWPPAGFDGDDESLMAVSTTPGWLYGIRWYSEGLGPGDLFIDDGKGGKDFYWLVENWNRAETRAVLFTDRASRRHPNFSWYEPADKTFFFGIHTELLDPPGNWRSVLDSLTPAPAPDPHASLAVANRSQ